MSKIEILTTISHRSLMNKSKSDLAYMVLEYADLAERQCAQLVEEITKRGHGACVYVGVVGGYAYLDVVKIRDVKEVAKKYTGGGDEHNHTRTKPEAKGKGIV